jgi:hypothetical protein
MLDNFVLSITSYRGNYEELHFTQNCDPPSALSVYVWFDKHFTGWWIGRRGPKRFVSKKSLSSFLQPLFWGVGPNSKSIDQTQKHLMKLKNKFRIILLLRLLHA